jgi:hypothetical protein
MAIAPISAASATSSNWLKEAQDAIASSESSGGMMGTLQSAAHNQPGSLRSFLASSQSISNNLALIAQSTATSAGALAIQMSDAAAQKRQQELAARAQALNPQETNFTPPAGLDPVIYFEDGTSIDTTTNIMTLPNGKQIDTTTGLEYHDPATIVSMANGAYLDTKNNILTMADGTKIDTVTGLAITV